MIESFFPTNGEKRFSFEATYTPKGIFSFNTSENRTTIIGSENGKIEVCQFPLRTKDLSREMKTSEFDVQGPVTCMRTFQPKNSGQTQIAVGGNENLMKIYDLETQKMIYSARNVKHDFLDLRQPVWISDIAFMGDGNLVANCTAYHQVRIYDRRGGRKPITQKSYMEHAYSKMIPSPCQTKEVIVGTVQGLAFRFNFEDIRKKKLWIYKGNAGSIRDLSCHPHGKYFASVGADRHVRVYDIRARKEVHKVYLAQRQNACLYTSDDVVKTKEDDEEEEKEEEEAEDENEEDPWEEIGTLESQQSKKRKMIPSDEEDEEDQDEEEEGEDQEEGEEEEDEE
jgi:ribosome biogenesis protein NSA1